MSKKTKQNKIRIDKKEVLIHSLMDLIQNPEQFKQEQTEIEFGLLNSIRALNPQLKIEVQNWETIQNELKIEKSISKSYGLLIGAIIFFIFTLFLIFITNI